MAAYRRVYDSRHLQADCKEPASAPVIEYGQPFHFFIIKKRAEKCKDGIYHLCVKCANQV